MASKSNNDNTNNDDDEVEPPRNFTLSQLHENDGTKVLRKNQPTNEDKPIYISLRHIVYDFSSAKEEYGPGGIHEAYAGHECAVAMAKMSMDEEYIDSDEFESLNEAENYELQRSIDKLQRSPRKYPVLGRVVPHHLLPSPDRTVSSEELSSYNGTQKENIPDGYAAHPIYVAIGGKVFDVSFGGVSLYTPPDGSYAMFSGKDVSRALAKMSFADVGNTDISDLTEKQRKTLNDWVDNFENKRKYPVVGKFG